MARHGATGAADRTEPSGVAGRLKSAWRVAFGAATAFFDHKAPKKSASLSFYTLFSLAPLVTVVLMLVALLADETTARQAFATQLGALIGPDAAKAVLAVADASSNERSGTIASLAALATTLVGATTVFAELKDSLDEIWEVEAVPRKGWWELVRARLLSFGLLLAVGFLLLVSLFVSTVLATVGTQLNSSLSGLAWLAEALNLGAALAAVTLLFAAIFKLLPNARLAWRDVWSGAILTAVLFTIGKTLIGLYLGATAATSAFGAAGSLVVVVVWVYYSSWILFYGAEVTREFAQRHGTLQRSTAAATAGVRTAPRPVPAPPARPPVAGTAEPAPPAHAAATRPGSWPDSGASPDPATAPRREQRPDGRGPADGRLH